MTLDEGFLRDRAARLALEQKVRLLTGADFWALHDEQAIGLRRVVTSDGPAGVRGERWDEREPSANVPSPTALAATWDEARIERIGRLLAGEEGLPSPLPREGVLPYDEDIYVGYRAYDRDGREPLLPFGHGTGYTTWEYAALEAAPAPGGGARATVRLRNAGACAGREVVQLYAERPGGAVERPPRTLAGFAIADAGPGEETAVEIEVPGRALAHWDSAGWALEPGTVTLAAGRSSRDLRMRAEIRLG